MFFNFFSQILLMFVNSSQEFHLKKIDLRKRMKHNFFYVIFSEVAFVCLCVCVCVCACVYACACVCVYV